jgi:O-antigen ligase
MLYILIFTFLGILFYIFKRPANNFFDKEYKHFYIPMGIFILVALLSALTSQFKTVSFIGFLDRYEGFFVLTAYIIIMFLAMNGMKDDKAIRVLFICLMSSAFVITLLGSLQFFGYDYFSLGFIQDLITPAKLQVGGGSIKAKFPARTIFSTLYNPNYIGSYASLVMPIIIAILACVRKNSLRIALAVLLCMTALCWIGSNSQAGIVGMIIAFIILIVLLRKKILSHIKISAVVVVMVVAATIVLNLASGGAVMNKISSLLAFGITEDTSSMTAIKAGISGIKDIYMDSGRVRIETENGTLQVAIIDKEIALVDENEKQVNGDISQSTVPNTYKTMDNSNTSNIKSMPDTLDLISMKITDQRFNDMTLRAYPALGNVEIYKKDYKLYDFYISEKGLQSNSNRWMTYRNGRDIGSVGFKGEETLGTGRGYIWSRTLPLLKRTIIWGNGPDTFAIFFPQYDYLGKLVTYENGGMFVDKAHNYYLQTALNTGIVSLIALLAIFIMYFVSSIKLYIKEEFNVFISYGGLGCFAGVCGYLTAAFFNDSVVAVAPVFWAVLGTGIAINTMIRRKKNDIKI